MLRTATKLRGAFRELDPLPDDERGRVLVAARGSLLRRSLRACTCLFLAILPAALAFVVAVIRNSQRPFARPTGQFTTPEAVAFLLLVTSPLPFLLWRDLFLRRGVRKVLLTRSGCRACSRSLAGTPVTEGNSVTCRACGLAQDVDPLPSDFAGPEGDQRVFAPRISESLEARRPTPERRKRNRRRLAVGLGVPLALVAIAAAGQEFFIRRQAAIASADMPAANALVLLTKNARAFPTTPDEPDARLLLVEAVTARHATDARVWRTNPPRTSIGREVEPDLMSLLPDYIAVPPQRDKEYDDAVRALSRRLVDEYRQEGLYDTLDKLTLARRSSTLYNPQSTLAEAFSLRDIKVLAGINSGRMSVAVERGDVREFARAFEANLAIGRLLRLQPRFIDGIVAVTVELVTVRQAITVMMNHPSAQWLDAASAALARQERPGSMALSLEGERFFGLAEISKYFSNPSNTRWGIFNAGTRAMIGGPFNLSDRLGTYAANKAAFNAAIDAAIARSNQLPFERTPAAPGEPSDLFMVRMITPSFLGPALSQDVAEIDRRGLVVIIALERCRLATGAYPASLDSLVPTYITSLPADPWSGTSFGYVTTDPATDRAGRAYYLYSIAADRTDNKSDSPAGPGSRNAPCLTDTGYIIPGDYTINGAD